MSTIYEEEQTIRKIIRRKLRGGMNSRDNVLYFNNNIDVRLCPKNGISTLKWALWHTYDMDISKNRVFAGRCGTKNHRIEEIRKHGLSEELPFRANSTRICVVRDPIERFMSAAEYLKLQWVANASILEGSDLNHEDKTQAYTAMSEIDILPDNIDEVIEGVHTGEIDNSHFWLQSYYLGNRSQYDHIFKFSQFGQFMTWLQNECKSPKSLNKIVTNQTSGLYYGVVSNLTEDQKRRIMKIYEEDYDYGWTENGATKSF